MDARTSEQAGGGAPRNGRNELVIDALRQLTTRCRDDAAVRARVESGDYSDAELDLPPGMELRIMQQTPETFYFTLPPEPNLPLADEMLEAVAGGASESTAIGCLIVLPPGATPQNLGWV